MADRPDAGLTKGAALDLYFLEHRAKLLDIAAFLDRVERASGEEDFRLRAFRETLALLTDGEPERARRVLEKLSDATTEPIDSSRAGKGAVGAPPE
jgi:hypothetical protein